MLTKRRPMTDSANQFTVALTFFFLLSAVVQFLSFLKLEKIEDWVKTSVDSVSWLPTLEPPVNPMLQGNIEQAPRGSFLLCLFSFNKFKKLS